MIMNLSGLFKDHNQWLVIIFIVYAGCIVFFAIVYRYLYRRERSHFLFAADISKARYSLVKKDTENELEESRLKADILIRLLEFLQNDTNDTNVLQKEIRLDDGSRIVLGSHIYIPPGVKLDAMLLCSVQIPEITLFDSKGVKLGTWHEVTDPPTYDKDGFKRLTKLHLDAEKYAVERCRNLLNSLEKTGTPTWSFWEFLYFSTITQTTLGYGDILPNSSTVRGLVMFQVIMGLILLVVIINLVIQSG